MNQQPSFADLWDRKQARRRYMKRAMEVVESAFERLDGQPVELDVLVPSDFRVN